jgi:hypothetical protein
MRARRARVTINNNAPTRHQQAETRWHHPLGMRRGIGSLSNFSILRVWAEGLLSTYRPRIARATRHTGGLGALVSSTPSPLAPSAHSVGGALTTCTRPSSIHVHPWPPSLVSAHHRLPGPGDPVPAHRLTGSPIPVAQPRNSSRVALSRSHCVQGVCKPRPEAQPLPSPGRKRAAATSPSLRTGG